MSSCRQILALVLVLPASPAHAQQRFAEARAGSATLPVVEESLTVTIDHQYATTGVRQILQNRAGASVEGAYDFTTCGVATVTSFAYWNGVQKIVGEVFERDAAEKVYNRIVSKRRDPGLLRETSRGRFSFKIFPIAVDERKRVEFVVEGYLRRMGRTVEYCMPLARPDAQIIVTLQDLRPLTNIRSSSHRIETRERGKGELEIRATAPLGTAGPLLLTYEIADDTPVLTVYAHRDPGDDAGTYLVLSLASHEAGDDTRSPLDVTVLVDRSQSMRDEPLRLAKTTTHDILGRLAPSDRFNVIAFGYETSSLYDRPRSVSPRVKDETQTFVGALAAEGGSNLAAALSQALFAQHPRSEPSTAGRRQLVIVLSDGRADLARLLFVARDRQTRLLVYALGLGPEPNMQLVERLTALYRGFARPTPLAKDAARAIDAILKERQRPLLTDSELIVSGATAETVSPRILPDLFSVDELVVVARLKGHGEARVGIRGTRRDDGVWQSQQLVDLDRATRRPWVARLWALERAQELYDLSALRGPSEAIERELVELSLTHNFVTPYTAFLAVPEAELDTAAADTLAAARQRKRTIIASKTGSDAATAPSTPPETGAADLSRLAPTTDAHASEPGASESAASQPERAGERTGDGPPPSRRPGEPGPVVEPARGGCASCSAVEPTLALFWLSGLPWWRRRRSTRGADADLST